MVASLFFMGRMAPRKWLAMGRLEFPLPRCCRLVICYACVLGLLAPSGACDWTAVPTG